MMTKKCYAHIKTSIELSNKIKELLAGVNENSSKEELLAVIKDVTKRNNVFNIQFRDTNPDWFPPGMTQEQWLQNQQKRQMTNQQPAPAQPQQVMIYQMDNGDMFAN